LLQRLWSIQFILPLILLLSVATIASVIWSVNYTQSQKGINSVAMIARNYALASLVQQVIDNNGRNGVHFAYEQLHWLREKLSPNTLYNSTILLRICAVTVKTSNLAGLRFAYNDDSVIGIRQDHDRFEETFGIKGNTTTYLVDIDTLERKSVIRSLKYYPTTRSWYKDAVSKKTFTYTSPFWTTLREPTSFLFTLSVPVYSETGSAKKLEGVIEGIINLSLFTNVLPTFIKEEHSVSLLVDKNGYLLGTSQAHIRPPDPNNLDIFPTVFNTSIPETYVGMKLLNNTLQGLKNVPSNRTARVHYKSSGNKYSLFARSITDPDGLFVVAVLICRDSDILQSVYRANNICCAVCVSFIVLTVMVALIIGYCITRPLHAFSMEMKQIANMEFDRKHVSGMKLSELSEMKDCMNMMKQALLSFEAYVPSSVVKYIVRNKQQATLGVVPRDLSILFVDIKDFTTITENISPNDLVNVMCTFFTSMSDIVHQNKGIVDKYVSTCSV
jgi:adenylate cyclase